MRLIIYDRTCVRRGGGLTIPWAIGARLYRGLGRSDVIAGVASWTEAFDVALAQPEPLRELQYWGHGKWGRVFVDRDVLDAEAFAPAHALHDRLHALRERLAPDALVWLRTCETFGAERGHDFAQRLADFLGARIAGHTYVIGFHQSGLHGLEPGARPDWATDEGLARGTPDAPERAKGSRPWAPRTLTCLASAIPASWFTRADTSAPAGSNSGATP